MLGHKLKITIDGDGVQSTLICPDNGSCPGATICTSCWRDTNDPEQPDACPECPSGDGECWLKGWADNEDMIHEGYCGGTFVVDIDAGWNHDVPEITIVEPGAVPGAESRHLMAEPEEVPMGLMAAVERRDLAFEEAQHAWNEVVAAIGDPDEAGLPFAIGFARVQMESLAKANIILRQRRADHAPAPALTGKREPDA